MTDNDGKQWPILSRHSTWHWPDVDISTVAQTEMWMTLFPFVVLKATVSSSGVSHVGGWVITQTLIHGSGPPIVQRAWTMEMSFGGIRLRMQDESTHNGLTVNLWQETTSWSNSAPKKKVPIYCIFHIWSFPRGQLIKEGQGSGREASLRLQAMKYIQRQTPGHSGCSQVLCLYPLIEVMTLGSDCVGLLTLHRTSHTLKNENLHSCLPASMANHCHCPS